LKRKLNLFSLRNFREEEKEAVVKKCESYCVVNLRYINDLLIKGYCVWVEPVSPRKETRENLSQFTEVLTIWLRDNLNVLRS
jgi:hypothetical protein